MAIVNSDKWEKALRSYTEVDTIQENVTEGDGAEANESAYKICGIRRMCCCKNHGANKQFTTPMRRIIKKMPG